MTKRADQRTFDGSDSAWQAFVEADARVCAPPGLEERVWQAIQSRHVSRPVSRVSRLAGLSLAAGVALSVVPALERGDETRDGVLPGQPVSMQTMDVYRDVLPAARPLRQTRVVVSVPANEPVAAPVLMTLAADPLQETEVLRVVRLRLPRGALQSLGLAVLEPEAQGSVDVDVVVGEDGVAREIRQLRAGQE